MQDSKAVCIITSDESLRGGKTIPLKKTVDAALASCPTVKNVFVVKRTGVDVPMAENHAFLQPLMSREESKCTPEVMDSEDPLFILYTSGSTGKPKGMIHTTVMAKCNYPYIPILDSTGLRPSRATSDRDTVDAD